MHYPFALFFLFLSSRAFNFFHTNREERNDDYDDEWGLNQSIQIKFDKFLTEVLMIERDYDVFAMFVGNSRICSLCKYVSFAYRLHFINILL